MAPEAVYPVTQFMSLVYADKLSPCATHTWVMFWH